MTNLIEIPFGEFVPDSFWKKWRYLQNMQIKRLWTSIKRPVHVDVVLLMDKKCKRNLWPMGTFSGQQKKRLRNPICCNEGILLNGKRYIYERPIHEIVPLL